MYMKKIAMILGIFLMMSMVFAGIGDIGTENFLIPTSDNIKLYDSDTKTVSVVNKDTYTIAADIQLLTPLNNLVGVGYVKVAEFEVRGQEYTTDFLKEMYFFNKNNDRKNILLSYDLRYRVDYTEDEPIYENICNDKELDKNGDPICEIKVTGTKKVDKVRYDLLTDKSIGEETKIISIWTNTEEGDSIEWIPDMYGVVVDEWAGWNSTILANLKGYWDLNELSGNPADRSGNGVVGTSVNVNYNEDGVIDKSFNFWNSPTYGTVDFNNSSYFAPTHFTWCFWATHSTTDSNPYFFITRDDGTATGISYQFTSYALNDYFAVGSATGTGGAQVDLGNNSKSPNWHFYCGSFDGSKIYGWVDNVLVATGNFTGTIVTADINTRFGGRQPGDTGLKGNLDEVSFWDVNLTASQVSSLYNAGDGLTFCGATGFNYEFDNPCVPAAPDINYTIDFNVYRKDTTNLLNHVDMDCNVDIYDVINQTSPFQETMLGDKTYSCDFSVFQGYDTNTVEINIDSNKTIIIYLEDIVAPTTTTAGGNTTYSSSNGSITMTCDDLNGSGCQEIRINVDGGGWGVYTGAIPITTDGNHEIQYISEDNAGNVEGLRRIYYALDKTGPTVGLTTLTAFSIFGGYINGTGNIIGGVATDALSGLNTTTCQYTINNGASWDASAWNTDHCETIGYSINDGITYTFNTRIRDNATNYGAGTATAALIGDTSGPTTTDNAVADYTDNPTITLSCVDAESGCQNTWYCVDVLGTCTPDTIGTSVGFSVPNGFIDTHYIRYFSQDNLDNNEAVNTSIEITIDRFTTVPYPDNNSNTQNWMTVFNMGAGQLFGFDYTIIGIFGLLLCAIACFLFRINALISIIISIPLTIGFILLAGGASYILSAILVLEIIALAVKIASALFAVGKQGE